MEKIANFFFKNYFLLFVMAIMTLPLSILFRESFLAFLIILGIQVSIGLIALARVIQLTKNQE